jgi:hypothetical protein
MRAGGDAALRISRWSVARRQRRAANVRARGPERSVRHRDRGGTAPRRTSPRRPPSRRRRRHSRPSTTGRRTDFLTTQWGFDMPEKLEKAHQARLVEFAQKFADHINTALDEEDYAPFSIIGLGADPTISEVVIMLKTYGLRLAVKLDGGS